MLQQYMKLFCFYKQGKRCSNTLICRSAEGFAKYVRRQSTTYQITLICNTLYVALEGKLSL
jgi:hypothetical protein